MSRLAPVSEAFMDLNDLRRLREQGQNGSAPAPLPPLTAQDIRNVGESRPAQPVPPPPAPTGPTGLASEIPTLQRVLREDHMDNETTVEVPGSSVHDHDGWRAKLGHIVGEIVKDESMDRAEIKKKLLAAAAMVDSEMPGGGGEPSPEPTPPPTEPAPTEPEPPAPEPEPEEPEPEMEESIKALKNSTVPGEKELYESVLAVRKQQAKIKREIGLQTEAASFKGRVIEARKLCEGSKLKDLKEGITDFFVTEVASARDEKGMRKLIENRVQVMSVNQRPTSSAGFVGGADLGDNTQMAKKIAEELVKFRR